MGSSWGAGVCLLSGKEREEEEEEQEQEQEEEGRRRETQMEGRRREKESGDGPEKGRERGKERERVPLGDGNAWWRVCVWGRGGWKVNRGSREKALKELNSLSSQKLLFLKIKKCV